MHAAMLSLERAEAKATYLEFCESARYCTPFHSLSWNLAISRAIGSKFNMLQLSDDSEVIAILPFHKREGKLHFSAGIWGGYGGFLTSEEGEDRLRYWLRGSVPKCIFPILLTDYFNNELYRHSVCRRSHDTWVVNSESGKFEGYFDNVLNPKIRNQIRKCKKSGVIIRNAVPDDLARIFALYQNFCKEKNVGQIYKAGFFGELCGAPKSEVECIVADLNGVLIAVAIFLKTNFQTFYWQSYFDRNYSVSNPISGILSEVLKGCFDSALCREFNFGAVPAGASSLAWFKKNWGALSRTYSSSVVWV